jgi:hypothetical protein
MCQEYPNSFNHGATPAFVPCARGQARQNSSIAAKLTPPPVAVTHILLRRDREGSHSRRIWITAPRHPITSGGWGQAITKSVAALR